MMILAWHRAPTPYPVLHYVQPAAKGEGEPDTRNRILQQNMLTEEQGNALDAAPDGVSRVAMAAQFYPYNPPATLNNEVDTAPTISEIYNAIDGAVDAYRQRMRKYDGQTAQIDKENGSHV